MSGKPLAIPGFGGGLRKWVWEKVLGRLVLEAVCSDSWVWRRSGRWVWEEVWEAVCSDSWVWRRSGRWSGRLYVAIPGFGGGGLGGGSGETVRSDSWVWRRLACPWWRWDCVSLGDVSGAVKTQHAVEHSPS